LTFEDNPLVNIRVLPCDTGAHAGLTGALDLYRFADGPTILCTESYGSGYPTANPDTVKE
jgi:hypothetical protein